MTSRVVLLAAVSASALLSSAAYAQSTQGQQATSVEEVVVTGTRTAGRTRLDTLAPVDVVTQSALSRQGNTELADALARNVPSLDFPRPSLVDGTDAIRPATLRGLSPDQTLVLLNGVRQHASALVNLNGSVGRGSAAVDLNTIPSLALDRAEVLRDGASAQYGSDAIGGVINLRLRQAREGGGAVLTYGQYNTDVDGTYTSRHENDGETFTAGAWQGFALGSDGFLTATVQYREAKPTSRGDVDVRTGAPNPPQVTSRYGDPFVRESTVWVNAAKPFADGWEAYGVVGYQYRKSQSAASPRLANNVDYVAAIYGGAPFLPFISSDSDDLTVHGGVRGDVEGWKTDVSLSYGRNSLDYNTNHSLNSTYGAASPTAFYDGNLTYDQFAANANASRGFEVGLFKPLNVAIGVEARREGYDISAGEPASYNIGPYTISTVVPGKALTPGAQGFTGLQPSNALGVSRNSLSAYLDLEAQFTEKFNAEAAVRAEHYSDFGDTVTGKLAARYDFTPEFALRASISNGFRAPSLQQSYFTSTASLILPGQTDPVQTLTTPPTSAVAQALGGKALEPEKSNNYAVGAVYRHGPLEITLDGYQIDIRNRIVLSENLSQSSVLNFLATQGYPGIGSIRFFMNGVNTTTKGVDLVARYRWNAGDFGSFDFTGAANYNQTDITRLPTNPVLSGLITSSQLFSRNQILTIEDGTPKQKYILAADWQRGPFGATIKGTYYGTVTQYGSAADGSLDVHTGDKTLLDLEARFAVTKAANIALGVDNVLDTYPNVESKLQNTAGTTSFTRFSPFGFNGRFLYARVSYNW